MPLPYNQTTIDGRTVAQENEMKILRSLRYFGHLRRQEVARLVWPRSSHKSAYLMALRTLKRMRESQYIFERDNLFRETSVALGSKGVARLAELQMSAQPGYAMAFTGAQFFHRTLSNNYLIDRARIGARVWPEYGLLAGYGKVTSDWFKSAANKVPDGVVELTLQDVGITAGHFAIEWIEVESAFKSRKELNKIFDVSRSLGGFISPKKNVEMFQAEGRFFDVFVDRLVFVYDTRAGHEKNILKALKDYAKEHGLTNDQEWLQRIVFARCYLDLPFAWHGYEEVTAAQLLSTFADDGSVVSELPDLTKQSYGDFLPEEIE